MLNFADMKALVTKSRSELSLPDVNGTVQVNQHKGFRRFLAYAGPAYLVSVGYMDPGNWATDLEGGSRYGYALLWVILVSSLMAVFLQTLCARLGIVAGKDLAQACRDLYPKPIARGLWVLAELGIVACDVAEVIGSAIGLKLLFGIDLLWGVLITGFDVLLLLGLMKFGFRKVEAITLTLVATIFISFGINIYYAHPNWGGVAHGLVTPALPDKDALMIAVGILGATVMPHNLYLHSSIVQTRDYGDGRADKRVAVRMSTLDTVIALSGAFFVNAAILVLAGAVFYQAGHVVKELEDANTLLRPALGGAASTLFAVALLASGQSSTMTGTLAGQVVMEGFVKLKITPWLRRLVTRGLAIIPAALIVTAAGHETNQALVNSQVVLSMQLPFAVIPLLIFTSKKSLMGEFASNLWVQLIGVVVAGTILVADVYLLATNYGWEKVAVGVALIAAYGLWAVKSSRKSTTVSRELCHSERTDGVEPTFSGKD